jgi:hypothetical protein
MSASIGVFVPQAIDALFSFHFDRCCINQLITVYNDRDQFVNHRREQKIACLQMPWPVDNEFDLLVTDLQNHCDRILILVSELHDPTVEFIKTHDRKNISYFICGDLNFVTWSSPVHKFYDWFTTTVHFYKHVAPELLERELTPYQIKPRYFDALLGRKKPHRDIAYERVDKNNNVVTYLNNISCDFSSIDKWRWESNGLVVEQPVLWTVDRVSYRGHRMSLSQIMPLEIYNETAYSLIAETCFSNHYSFYTEKTVKPILARRLFVSLTGQGALKNLRHVGFQTFSNVIDESYDDCSDLTKRCQRALDQVEYLCSLPQDSVLEKIVPICDHNYNHIMRTDWYNEYFVPAFVSYFTNKL